MNWLNKNSGTCYVPVQTDSTTPMHSRFGYQDTNVELLGLFYHPGTSINQLCLRLWKGQSDGTLQDVIDRGPHPVPRPG